jgi:hypothetical protein
MYIKDYPEISIIRSIFNRQRRQSQHQQRHIQVSSQRVWVINSKSLKISDNLKISENASFYLGLLFIHTIGVSRGRASCAPLSKISWATPNRANTGGEGKESNNEMVWWYLDREVEGLHLQGQSKLIGGLDRNFACQWNNLTQCETIYLWFITKDNEGTAKRSI